MGLAHDHRQFPPVGDIPFAIEITRTTRMLADRNGLAFHPFYHDLPLWIVHEHGQQRVRRLQVCAYFVSRDPYLSLVPSVHAFVPSGKILVPKVVKPERFAISEVSNESGQLDERKLLNRLERIWITTAELTYQPEELMEVQVMEQVSTGATTSRPM
jgi:hypothetical protein